MNKNQIIDNANNVLSNHVGGNDKFILKRYVKYTQYAAYIINRNSENIKISITVNYPETKDFGASWAGQSNLQPYLHTLEFPPFQRYLIC